jgi:hypothetical protein
MPDRSAYLRSFGEDCVLAGQTHGTLRDAGGQVRSDLKLVRTENDLLENVLFSGYSQK